MTAGVKANVDGSAAIQVGGSDAINISTGLDVGIGTSLPAASLSVTKQTTALSGTGNSYGLYMYPTSSGLTYIDAITNSTGNTSLGFRTYNNGTYNEMRMDSSGNVGIGTSSPVTRLDVNGSIKGVVTSGVAVASTSGTSIDFTGIPSWVKRITVMLNGVSTNGSSGMIARLGTSGGVVSSGYTTVVSIIAATSNTTRLSKASSSFPLVWADLASYLLYGNIVFTNLTGNTWTGTGLFYQDQGGPTDAHSIQAAGAIALSGTLDRIRITTNNGTDAFDAGTINILYEG